MHSCFSQLEEPILFPFLKALFQIACNSPSSFALQSTFNDTQGCGVPRLIQVHRGFFVIILLFKLSTEKMREKNRRDCFSGPFRSLEKKNHLKDKEFKRFDTEPTRKQSEIRNPSEGEDPVPDAGLGQASSRLHTHTAFPLGGQAVFMGLRARQRTSYQGYGLLPTAIPQVETEQKVLGSWSAALFKHTTAT